MSVLYQADAILQELAFKKNTLYSCGLTDFLFRKVAAHNAGNELEIRAKDNYILS